jgi:hypothetical protein
MPDGRESHQFAAGIPSGRSRRRRGPTAGAAPRSVPLAPGARAGRTGPRSSSAASTFFQRQFQWKFQSWASIQPTECWSMLVQSWSSAGLDREYDGILHAACHPTVASQHWNLFVSVPLSNSSLRESILGGILHAIRRRPPARGGATAGSGGRIAFERRTWFGGLRQAARAAIVRGEETCPSRTPERP